MDYTTSSLRYTAHHPVMAWRLFRPGGGGPSSRRRLMEMAYLDMETSGFGDGYGGIPESCQIFYVPTSEAYLLFGI